MTTQTHRRSAAPARSAVHLEPALRQHRVDVARWALAEGRTLNLDAVTVVIAARSAEAAVERRPFRRWTSQSLLTFVFGTTEQWARAYGVAVPTGFGQSLFTYLDYLADHGELASGSSPIAQLRRTLSQLCGLTPDGHERETPHPDTGRRAVEPTPLGSRRQR